MGNRTINMTTGGLTQGFSTFVARAFGEKNYREMSRFVAMSVVLCTVIGSILTIVGIFAAKPHIHLDRQMWRIDKNRIKKMLVFGLPIALQYVVITTGGMILQSAVNLQGSLFIAGYTATNKLYSFLQCFAMSFGVSACTFLAQNYGAGLYDRFQQGVADAVKIVSVTAFVITGIALLTRWQILQVFLDVNETGGTEALEIAVRYLTLMAPCFIIVHLLHVFRNVLQAMGIAVWALASGVAEFLARVFMSCIVINRIGADALFIAEPASWLGAMLCVFLPYFYYRKKYLRRCS